MSHSKFTTAYTPGVQEECVQNELEARAVDISAACDGSAVVMTVERVS